MIQNKYHEIYHISSIKEKTHVRFIWTTNYYLTTTSMKICVPYIILRFDFVVSCIISNLTQMGWSPKITLHQCIPLSKDQLWAGVRNNSYCIFKLHLISLFWNICCKLLCNTLSIYIWILYLSVFHNFVFYFWDINISILLSLWFIQFGSKLFFKLWTSFWYQRIPAEA